ncbi:hypothetical protein LCGC14_0807880 [marine sediment metagenome]|uniref:Uncharacterized protein n=1 Tax=marine sediment metagenome TaxID=412755 RepID=A0A0F9PS74_9ZZZZ
MAEQNQLNWRGIRPTYPVENIQTHPGPFETAVAGKARTQIVKSVEVANTTTIIHTVTAGKTFYLCSCSCSADTGINKLTHLKVRNASDTDQYTIIDHESSAQATIFGSLSFFPPISIPAGWDIVLTTNAAQGMGFIHGWEE